MMKTVLNRSCCAQPGPKARSSVNCQNIPYFQIRRPNHFGGPASLYIAQPVHRRTTVVEAQNTAKELSEYVTLDSLIDKLLGAKDRDELVQQVTENILSFDQRFWVRIATRSDSAESKEDKERLSSLANTVMRMVEAVVKAADSQLSDSSTILQKILRAGADATGSWTLPLQPEKVQAMQKVMDDNSEQVDEALLANAYAWMRKASEDGLDGFIVVLQKVLQLYAARALGQASSNTEGADAVLDNVLSANEEEWVDIIAQSAQAGTISESSFQEALQKRMESTILNLNHGSYAQRVQAEYLKECSQRAEEAFKKLGSS